MVEAEEQVVPVATAGLGYVAAAAKVDLAHAVEVVAPEMDMVLLEVGFEGATAVVALGVVPSGGSRGVAKVVVS